MSPGWVGFCLGFLVGSAMGLLIAGLIGYSGRRSQAMENFERMSQEHRAAKERIGARLNETAPGVKNVDNL